MDIKKLLKQPKVTDVTNLTALFDTLDRKSSHTELRPAQLEALKALTERKAERDHVLKISTGSGKTTVGVLYLLSQMRQSKRGVVYLCPTIQLVGQVCEEARRLGVEALPYSRGESLADAKCSSAQAITVCTYDKLFNGLSTFNRQDMWLPQAIVLDDAHAGIEIVRQAFSLRLSGSAAHTIVHKALAKPYAKYNPSAFFKIDAGDPHALVEVPHWIWRDVAKEVMPRLAQYEGIARQNDEAGFFLPWQFIQHEIESCRCVMSGNTIEIAPVLPRLDLVQPFSRAAGRLFMSATLVDDSALVRELGCDAKAAMEPIVPSRDRGVGERMVVAPNLIDPALTREEVAALCGKFAKQGYRVAVLTRSEADAAPWVSSGARVARGNDVATAVEGMKAGAAGYSYMVFPRRYDGVDLADDACRILVIDGIPTGDSLIDRLDSGQRAVPGGARNRLIYRLEQGMGRATRSHADFAVVLLAGPDLANFIVRTEVLELVNSDTRAQVKLAQTFEEGARDESSQSIDILADLMNYCLRRNEDWKQVYDQRVRQPQAEAIRRPPDKILIKLASEERASFDEAVVKGRPGAAGKRLQQAANAVPQGPLRAPLLQTAARYLVLAGDPDWVVVQGAALDFDRNCFRPPEVARKPRKALDITSQEAVISWFRQFDNPNGAILALDDLKRALTFGDESAEPAEAGLRDLGKAIGFDASRPEEELGEGSDGLWLIPGAALVVEVKSENKESLHKKDAGQLMTSLNWFEKAYGKQKRKITPVLAARMSVADKGSHFPPGARVFTPSRLAKLVDNLQVFYRKVGELLPIEVVPNNVQRLQAACQVHPDQIIGTYTEPVKEES